VTATTGRYGLKGSLVCGEGDSSGSFAALRMTAETCNHNYNCNCNYNYNYNYNCNCNYNCNYEYRNEYKDKDNSKDNFNCYDNGKAWRWFPSPLLRHLSTISSHPVSLADGLVDEVLGFGLDLF
jgi:hypothetical protein